MVVSKRLVKRVLLMISAKGPEIGGMKRVRITAMRRTVYEDLIREYERPLENPCAMRLGQVFVAEEGRRPEGLCESAWESMEPFVRELAAGGGDFFGGWLKNPHAAMISCNDGFRPVSFLLEALAD